MNKSTIYICEDLLNDNIIIKDYDTGESYTLPTHIARKLSDMIGKEAVAKYEKLEDRKLQLA